MKTLTNTDAKFTLTATPCDIDAYTDLAGCMSKKEIKALLREADWNVWQWCNVEVNATYKGLEASAYLGACSYKDEDDFRENSGYFEEMQAEALADIQAQAEAIASALA